MRLYKETMDYACRPCGRVAVKAEVIKRMSRGKDVSAIFAVWVLLGIVLVVSDENTSSETKSTLLPYDG